MYGMLLQVRLPEPCSPQHLSSMQLPAPIRPSRVLQTNHPALERAPSSSHWVWLHTTVSVLSSLLSERLTNWSQQTARCQIKFVRAYNNNRWTKKTKKKNLKSEITKSCVFFLGVSWKSKHHVSRTAPLLRFPFSVWARVLFLTAAESVLMIELFFFLVVKVKEQKLAQREEEE